MAEERPKEERSEANEGKPKGIDQRLVLALSHPVRVQILEALSDREASPNELVGLLEHPIGNIAYHTRVLEKYGCIEQVRTEPRRGATEHFFRARPRSFVGHQDWRLAPRSVRGGVTGAQIQTFIDKLVAASEAGTLDGRDDTTLNCMTIAVDLAGWTEASEILDDARARLQAVHEESRKRMEASGEAATSMIIGTAGFEAPPPGSQPTSG